MTPLPALPPATVPVPCVRPLRWRPAPARTGGGLRLPPAAPEPVAPPALVADDPATRRAIATTLRLACEVLDGRRDPDQLACHLTPPALRYWRAAAGRRHGGPGPTRVVRVRVCRPSDDAAEVAAVCDRAGRARAVAARFDRRRGNWWCTAIRLG